MNVGIVVALVAALVGPLLTYIVAVRRLSGKIGTSEASSLWEESRSIRGEYREQIAVLAERCRRLEDQLDKLAATNAELKAENDRLGVVLVQQSELITQLQAKIERIETENTNLKETIGKLEKRLGE